MDPVSCIFRRRAGHPTWRESRVCCTHVLSIRRGKLLCALQDAAWLGTELQAWQIRQHACAPPAMISACLMPVPVQGHMMGLYLVVVIVVETCRLTGSRQRVTDQDAVGAQHGASSSTGGGVRWEMEMELGRAKCVQTCKEERETRVDKGIES